MSNPGVRKTVVVVLLIMAVFVALLVYRILQPRYLSPDQMALHGLMLNESPGLLMDFSLSTEDGRRLSRDDLMGSWSVFVFTHSACSAACMNHLASVVSWYQALPESSQQITNVYAFTVSSQETAKELSEFIGQFKAPFRSVSGGSVEALAASLGVRIQALPNSQGFDIESKIVIINPEGRFVGYFVPSFDLAKMKLSYGSLISYY